MAGKKWIWYFSSRLNNEYSRFAAEISFVRPSNNCMLNHTHSLSRAMLFSSISGLRACVIQHALNAWSDNRNLGGDTWYPAPRATLPPGVMGPTFYFAIAEVLYIAYIIGKKVITWGSLKWNSQKKIRQCFRKTFNCGQYMDDKHFFL